MEALDKLDRQILRSLQTDGRATYDEIADTVGLSPSAVLRRVKRLESVGVIDRYVALVKPEAVGLGLTAYINVRLEKHAESAKRNPMDLFRASVQAWPEVVECAALTGEMDFLLRLVVADMAAYSRFMHGHPAQAPERAGLQDQFRHGTGQIDHGRAPAVKADAGRSLQAQGGKTTRRPLIECQL